MEVKIGVQNVARELTVETNEDPEDITRALDKAIQDGSVFAITDTKGRAVVVPAAALAYVEVGGGVTGPVGFLS